MYAGSTVVSGELHASLGLALAALAYGCKVRLEEAVLMKHFGGDYGDYCRQTWALVPEFF
jgi:protein-S-isoprenylcysteine O-methyltransferase Ste14